MSSPCVFPEETSCVSPVLTSWGPSKILGWEQCANQFSWMNGYRKEKSTVPVPRPYVIHIVCIHCLKELSDRVIPWIFPDWMCDHFWHIPHSICRKNSWCSECSYKKQIPVYKQITSSAQNLCPWFLTAPPWLAVGSELSVRRHWQPLFFLLLLSSGFEEVQQCCSGDCSSVMQRCFRTMLWCLVAPTTTETSPEVKLWSKRKLWRNFYLICIPLIHLHIHPAQYASLLATSTC